MSYPEELGVLRLVRGYSLTEAMQCAWRGRRRAVLGVPELLGLGLEEAGPGAQLGALGPAPAPALVLEYPFSTPFLHTKGYLRVLKGTRTGRAAPQAARCWRGGLSCPRRCTGARASAWRLGG